MLKYVEYLQVSLRVLVVIGKCEYAILCFCVVVYFFKVFIKSP